VIAAPPPPIVADAGTVFGEVAVRVGARTEVLEMVVDGKVRARLRLPGGPRRVSAPLPVGDHMVSARARGDGGTRRSAAIRIHVLPRSAARLGRVPGRVDVRLQKDVEALTSTLPATPGVYVQHLITGCGAAVNAGAPFPAASTLKAAILIDAVRRSAGRPAESTGRLLDQMIVDSSDRAANTVLAGSSRPEAVTNTMREMGLTEALVRRPYIIEDARLPLDATSRPSLYTNFIATPFELARIMVSIHRAALGGGVLPNMGVSPRAARVEMMPRLLSVRDRTKIVAGVPPEVPVMHKSGFTEQVKHDAGIVYLKGGPVVVVAMSWAQGGVTDATGDQFIANIARASVARLARGGRC
jgi:beta-lactamase class A